MGFLDRLLGREPVQNQGGRSAGPAYPQGQAYPQGSGGPQDSMTGASAQDRQAIARYRYLLRTAPPEQIEEAHAQAFAQLSPAQRQQVLQEMTQTLPAGDLPQSDDPRQLARAATRAEMQQPGYLQRTFGGRGYAGGGMGGGMMGSFGGSLLGTVAGVVIGTAVADSLMGGFDGSQEHQDMAGDGADGGGGDGGDPGSGGDGDGSSADQAGAEAGGAADTGGDAAWGGDEGGFGDVGGGDFGGGDFM